MLRRLRQETTGNSKQLPNIKPPIEPPVAPVFFLLGRRRYYLTPRKNATFEDPVVTCGASAPIECVSPELPVVFR